MVRLAESRFAQQEMKRLADELRELDQMAKGAKEAMAIFMRFAEWERSKDEDPIR
jgi:superfamily I DNA/RNA helicase